MCYESPCVGRMASGDWRSSLMQEKLQIRNASNDRRTMRLNDFTPMLQPC
jgi:hypothetical protein